MNEKIAVEKSTQIVMIWVTKADIKKAYNQMKNGVQRDWSKNCPIAQTLKRRFPQIAENVIVGFNHVSFKIGARYCRFDLPENASLLSRWSCKMATLGINTPNVHPIKFEIEIDREIWELLKKK